MLKSNTASQRIPMKAYFSLHHKKNAESGYASVRSERSKRSGWRREPLFSDCENTTLWKLCEKGRKYFSLCVFMACAGVFKLVAN